MYTNQVSFIIAVIAVAEMSSAELQGIQKRQIINPHFNAVEDTIFYLFTPKNKDLPNKIGLDNHTSLSASNFNNSNPTRFITHGWINDVTGTVNVPNLPVNVLIRKAYFQKGNFNIISVDWSKGANNLDYLVAQNNTIQVGQVIAHFINFLCQSTGISTSSIYLIGHSLGAHTNGIAGKILKSLYQRIIHTIFGLDPALPDYYIPNPNITLDPADAYFVEDIHTNCGLAGFIKPLGQATYYPNWGGPEQPGCGINAGCPHERSFEYFAESINTERFIGHKCANYQEITRPLFKKCTMSGNDTIMGGEPSRPGTLGVFYLPTSGKSPYALGQFPYNTLSIGLF